MMAAKPKLEESLEDQLERIYSSLEGLEFEAWYDERRLIKSTGQERDVLAVTETSIEVNEALETILAALEEEEFEGVRLSEIVWKGITHGYKYKVWVQVPPPDFMGYDVQDYCQVGKKYSFTLTTPTVDIFSEVDWQVPDYKAGVNIHVRRSG